MTERQLTTELQKYFKVNPLGKTVTMEIKMVKGSFAFNSVKPHQIDGLLASLQGLQHKISDSPIYEGSKNRFTFKKPFDLIYIKADSAYVIPIFYVPHKVKTAVLIPIENFIAFKKNWAKKSVHLEDLDIFRNIKL